MLEQYRFGVGKFKLNFSTFNLTGSDTADFLQKQSTFNFSLLGEKEFHLASFLDAQGRIEFYGWFLKCEQGYKVLVPIALESSAHLRLEKFLISEDVMIERVGHEDWTIALGPESLNLKTEDCFQGQFFEERALLTKVDTFHHVEVISEDDREKWRRLNGWPDLFGKNFKNEIINNTRLYDLSVSPNKGCYPGQETVSKIAVNRGAAFAPVLLETSAPLDSDQIITLGKKIGEIEFTIPIENKFLSGSKILRDFRVQNLEIKIEQEGKNQIAIVRYYPFYSGLNEDKAQENYYRGIDAFKVDDLDLAEKYFNDAIKLDPKYSDAYESLGVMLGRQERFTEAIVLMDELNKIDPTSVLAHTNKSLYLMRLGKIEEAEQEKSMATIKSFQRFGDEAKLKEKMNEEKLRQEAEWKKREKMFKQVLEIDLEDTLANYGMGSIEVERKNWKEAQGYLEKVIQVDSLYSVAYLALGKAYQGLGLKDQARQTWQKGIEIAARKGDLMPANQMQLELSNL